MSNRQTDDYIEGIFVTRFAADSSTNGTLLTDGHGHKCQATRRILITAGAVFTVAGIGLLGLVHRISKVDTHSVIVVLSEDRMSQDALSKFRFTSWREPSGTIRPFVHGQKSFEGCRISRYRIGSRPNELFKYTYYEAEYLMPDGSLVIGPAFGPRPYTAPNLVLLGSLIVAGVIPLVLGIALRSGK